MTTPPHYDYLHIRNHRQRRHVTTGELRRAKLARRAARERYEREQREGWYNHYHNAAMRRIHMEAERPQRMAREQFRRNVVFIACLIALWGAVGMWAYMQPVTP